MIICLEVALIPFIIWALSGSYNLQTHVLSLNFLGLFYHWFPSLYFSLSLFVGLVSYSCWSYGPITFFLSFIFFKLIFYFYVFLLYYLGDLLNLIIPRFFWIFYSASPQVPFSTPLMFLKKIMQCSCFMGSISPLIPLWIFIIVFWSLHRLSFFHIAFCLLVSVSTFQVGFP